MLTTDGKMFESLRDNWYQRTTCKTKSDFEITDLIKHVYHAPGSLACQGIIRAGLIKEFTVPVLRIVHLDKKSGILKLILLLLIRFGVWPAFVSDFMNRIQQYQLLHVRVTI